ncbi:MAG: flagellar biosynthesis regulator FlaF [Gemmobacter sp.]
MTLDTHQFTTYGQHDTPVRTARGLEYDLFARVTARLKRGWSNRQEDFPGLVAALSDNSRLWSTLAADVASPGNALPAPLRAQLFYLYEFTAAHSRRVLDGTASVEALVDVNTAMMRGLRGAAVSP